MRSCCAFRQADWFEASIISYYEGSQNLTKFGDLAFSILSTHSMDDPPIKNLVGSCRCEVVRYRVPVMSGKIETINCHCKTCRKHSGAPFITRATVPGSPSGIHLKKDDRFRGAITTRKGDAAERGFCINCGSAIWMRYLFEPDTLFIAMGTVDDIEGLKLGEDWEPSGNILVEEKAKWFDLEDGIPEYARFRPGLEEAMDEWKRGKTGKLPSSGN